MLLSCPTAGIQHQQRRRCCYSLHIGGVHARSGSWTRLTVPDRQPFEDLVATSDGQAALVALMEVISRHPLATTSVVTSTAPTAPSSETSSSTVLARFTICATGMTPPLPWTVVQPLLQCVTGSGLAAAPVSTQTPRNLTALCLNHVQIDSADGACFRPFAHLKSLNIAYSRGLYSLLNMGPKPFLQELVCTASRLWDLDFLLELCPSSTTSPSIKKGHDPEAFDEPFPVLDHVDIARCRELTSLNGLRSADRLRHLDLSFIGGHSSAGGTAARIESLTPYLSPTATDTFLTTLCCYGCSSLSDISILSRCQSLEHLDLSCCRITSASMAALGPLRRLAVLLLVNNPHLTSLDGLGPKPMLRRLDLSGCAALTTMAGIGACPALTVLNLSDCGRMDLAADTEALARVEEMREEHAKQDERSREAGVSSGGARLFTGHFPRLQTLRLDRTPLTSLSFLIMSRSLVNLDLCRCRRLVSLAALGPKPALEVVDLAGAEWAIEEVVEGGGGIGAAKKGYQPAAQRNQSVASDMLDRALLLRMAPRLRVIRRYRHDTPIYATGAVDNISTDSHPVIATRADSASDSSETFSDSNSSDDPDDYDE